MMSTDQLEPLPLHPQAGSEEGRSDLHRPLRLDVFPQDGYATSTASAELADALQEAEAFENYNEGALGKRKADQVLDDGASSDANLTTQTTSISPGYSSFPSSSESHAATESLPIHPASASPNRATPINSLALRKTKAKTNKRSREVTTITGDPVSTPGPNDVTLGRGKGITTSSGNIKFRELVREKKEQYNQEHFKCV